GRNSGARAAGAARRASRPRSSRGQSARPSPRAPSTAGAAADNDRLPPQAYLDPALLAAEREQLLRPAWQVLGHEAELRTAGDYLSGETSREPVLLVPATPAPLHPFPPASPPPHPPAPARARARAAPPRAPEKRHPLRGAFPHLQLRRPPGRGFDTR